MFFEALSVPRLKKLRVSAYQHNTQDVWNSLEALYFGALLA